MIFEYVAGIFVVAFSFPQALIIGLLRGGAHQFSRLLPTKLRLIVDAVLGALTFILINQFWIWVFGTTIPILFLIGSLAWDYFFIDRNKLVGAAPGNQIATDLGTVFFLVGSLAFTDFIMLPLSDDLASTHPCHCANEAEKLNSDYPELSGLCKEKWVTFENARKICIRSEEATDIGVSMTTLLAKADSLGKISVSANSEGYNGLFGHQTLDAMTQAGLDGMFDHQASESTWRWYEDEFEDELYLIFTGEMVNGPSVDGTFDIAFTQVFKVKDGALTEIYYEAGQQRVGEVPLFLIPFSLDK